VLEGGRLVEDGAPQALLERDGPFSRLHAASERFVPAGSTEPSLPPDSETMTAQAV